MRAREFPRWHKDWTAAVEPLREHLVGDTRLRLLLLFGATGFVVLIACANLANLLLARGAVRVREMAMRAALGASRWRLLRQALAETLIVTLLGGAAGVALAAWATPLLVARGAAALPQLVDGHPDWRVLLFAFGSSMLAGLVAGLVPSLRASRPDLNGALKEAPLSPSGASPRSLGGALVVAQLACALLLLTGAGLMVQTLARLSTVDVGFRTDNLLTARVTVPNYKAVLPNRRFDTTRLGAFARALADGVRTLPGVRSVGLIDALPFSGVAWGTYLEAEGKPGEEFHTHTRSCNPEYFKAMGIPLLQGRWFTDSDTAGSAQVAIINDALARQLWPNQNPIGRHVTWEGTQEVVGVVGTVRHLRREFAGVSEVYRPLAQRPRREMFLAVRASGDAPSLTSAIRHQVGSIDKDQPVEDVQTMDARIAADAGPRRFYALLLCIFAGLAVTLAAVGIYGVIGWSVSRRQHEIGVRMALGARHVEVLALVFRQGLVLASLGVAVGLAGAVATTRVLASLLYEVQPIDPFTFACVSLLLVAVVAAACYFPAHRASRLDPLLALRTE